MAKGILKGMDVYRVKQAIMRAERKTLTSDGRTYRLGANASELSCFLLRRDGQGEAGDEIHATARQIKEEVGLTKRQQETARRVMADEGLLESRVGHRPSDGQRTVYYRLDMWEVARVVVEAELENIEAILAHEGRKTERDRLNKERRKLERSASDLRLDFLDDPSADVGGETAGESDRGVGTTWGNGYTRLGQLQNDTHTVTSVDKSTTVHNPSEDRAVDHVMKEIYHHLKDHGYPLDKGEYSFNLERLDTLYRHYAPTEAELAELLEICLRYFEFAGRLDVANAVRRHRQQSVRRELEAAEAWWRGGKSKGRGRTYYGPNGPDRNRGRGRNYVEFD